MATPVGKNSIIREALDYRLSTLVLSPVRRVFYEGSVSAPATGEICLVTHYMPNGTDFGSVGANAPRRHRGIYQIDVKGPTNGGPIPQSEVVDAVIEHFISQYITRNGLTVRIGTFDGGPSVPSAAPELTENGWTTIPVSVPWWCDTF